MLHYSQVSGRYDVQLIDSPWELKCDGCQFRHIWLCYWGIILALEIFPPNQSLMYQTNSGTPYIKNIVQLFYLRRRSK